MKVSIIVTVYNRIDLLRKALISINSQSYLPDELILSDDGSQEDITGGIKNLIPKLNFKILYVSQQDKGFRLARCKNNAVRAASGDYLIFNDQDIIATKNYIKTFVDYRKEKRFCVSYPVRLNENQNNQITNEMIEKCDYSDLLNESQIREIRKQYRKDKLYFYLKKLHLRDIGPKLRGGVFAAHRDDLLKVNGFNEKYQGWGNEDDDLGRRLDRIDVTGSNPFLHEFPLHLYHEPYNLAGRANKQYYYQQVKKIRKGYFYCKYGIINSLDNDEVVVRELK